jgi:hypothetical protein
MALYWTIDSRGRGIDVVADGEVSMADSMAFFDAVEGAKARCPTASCSTAAAGARR